MAVILILSVPALSEQGVATPCSMWNEIYIAGDILFGEAHRCWWQIDRLVYNLYGLTEDEIRIVEGAPEAG